MEGTTLTRPRPGNGLAARLRPPSMVVAGQGEGFFKLVFALLCLGFAIGFFVFPTYPVYDSYYSLLWGRDLLHGHPPVFEGFRYPTEHPLGIAAGAVLSLTGGAADRLWVALTLAAFLALVAGLYRLGRLAATPVVGAAAAALLLTRFDYPFLAARGYIDIPYMALVVWAAALEASRPRRGTPVLLLLAGAGLLRPEAWLLGAMYWCWMAWRASWRDRIRYAALAAIGPVVWAGVDAAVTGDPLFSLHYTSSSAEDLGRQRTLSELPSAVPHFFSSLIKLPVLLLAALGLALGVLMSPRRMAMPLLLLGAGLGTFVVIGIAGASVIERYLAVASLALLVFAGVALGGWTMLRPGRLRTAWTAAATIAVLGGIAFTATHLNLSRFYNELTFRGQAHHDLTQVLHDPRVQAGLRCGPLTGPNHKIVPDSRWIANLPEGKVLARASKRQPQPTKGVAIVVTSRFAIFKHAWTDAHDDALIQVPPKGFDRVKQTRFYAAYVNC